MSSLELVLEIFDVVFSKSTFCR